MTVKAPLFLFPGDVLRISPKVVIIWCKYHNFLIFLGIFHRQIRCSFLEFSKSAASAHLAKEWKRCEGRERLCMCCWTEYGYEYETFTRFSSGSYSESSVSLIHISGYWHFPIEFTLTALCNCNTSYFVGVSIKPTITSSKSPLHSRFSSFTKSLPYFVLYGVRI